MKTFQIPVVLFLFLCALPDFILGQDILYKKDSTTIEVNVKNFDGTTIVYQIPGDSPEKTYYLSKTLLDSLRYRDGKSLNFTYSANIKEIPLKMISRNYIGTELVNLLTGKGNFDYERMSETGRTGFVAGLLINFKEDEWDYWDEYHDAFRYVNFSPHVFFIRLGINFYPFHYSLARTSISRLSTGFSVLAGSYNKILFDYYTYTEGYMTKRVAAGSLMWNVKSRLYLGDHFQLNGGIEISIIPLLTFFCPQAGISIGF
jgi:hypothetical protein